MRTYDLETPKNINLPMCGLLEPKILGQSTPVTLVTVYCNQRFSVCHPSFPQIVFGFPINFPCFIYLFYYLSMSSTCFPPSPRQCFHVLYLSMLLFCVS